MNKWLPYVLILLLGAVVGAFLMRQFFPRYVITEQRDTMIVYDTLKFTEFVTERVPGPKEYVRIHVTDTIRKTDTIDRYILVDKQYYHTAMNGAEIWHSGVGSRIDSVNVFKETQVITQYVEQVPSNWRFNAYLGADYWKGKETYIVPNIGAEIAWKRISAHAEVGAMINRNIEPYWGIGVRYDLIHR